MELRNKKIAILGLGIEGVALAEFLAPHSNSITVLDKAFGNELLVKSEGEIHQQIGGILDNAKIAKVLGEDYLKNLSDFDMVFRSPGININDEKILKARENGVEISSQIKLFFDLCPCPIIGVTGTKGKGTTASLIHSILKKNIECRMSNVETISKFENKKDQKISNFQQVYLAGNIGAPAITLISELKSDDIVILELSSFQLIDLHKSPALAVVTNLTTDHLDYHKDEAEYRDAKFNILKFQGKSDFAIMNADSTFEEEKISKLASKTLFFTGKKSDGDAIIRNIDGEDAVILDPSSRNIEVCRQGEVKLLGRHNLENIAAATLVADILGVEAKSIKEAVKSFEGLPHRLEFVGEIDGVKFINDSFATNPGPTMAAIKSFSENKVLILGGSSKGADFQELAETISCSNVKAVVVIGDEGEKIIEALEGAGYKGMVYEAGYTFKDAVKLAKVESQDGDIVLFSPACASFDMFKNYKDRGVQFKNAVLNLIET